MKALILYKKGKYWGLRNQPNLFENLVIGLLCNDFEVIVVENDSDVKPDLLIQWHTGRGSVTMCHRYKAKYNILIEKGWFDRHNNLLLYNEKIERYQATKIGAYKDFYKDIPDIEPKVWLILGQREGDVNLRNCPDYQQWIKDTKEFLERNSDIPVYFRPHPDYGEPKYDLTYDLGRAKGVIAWNSSGLLKAMMHGIPCCCWDLPETKLPMLSREWIDFAMSVEKNRLTQYQKDLLNYFAGQQYNIKEFSRIDYYKLLRIKHE